MLKYIGVHLRTEGEINVESGLKVSEQRPLSTLRKLCNLRQRENRDTIVDTLNLRSREDYQAL